MKKTPLNLLLAAINPPSSQKLLEIHSSLIRDAAKKFALNPGAKNLVERLIDDMHTTDESGRKKPPRKKTIPSDAILILQELQVIDGSKLLSRNRDKTHEEREAWAENFAVEFSNRLIKLRFDRRDERSKTKIIND